MWDHLRPDVALSLIAKSLKEVHSYLRQWYIYTYRAPAYMMSLLATFQLLLANARQPFGHCLTVRFGLPAPLACRFKIDITCCTGVHTDRGGCQLQLQPRGGPSCTELTVWPREVSASCQALLHSTAPSQGNLCDAGTWHTNVCYDDYCKERSARTAETPQQCLLLTHRQVIHNLQLRF